MNNQNRKQNRKTFTFDFVNKTIVGSKRSIERANKGLSPEYEELIEMLKKQPTFEVVAKVIKVNKNKRKYTNLTFNKMEDYIRLQSNSKELLKEYNLVKAAADTMTGRYPLTKKWFLAKFPEYKNREIVIDDQLNDTSAGEEAA